MKHIYEKITFPSTEEWRIHGRPNGIGGSEVAILFGDDHWGTPMTLAERKKEERNGIFHEQTVSEDAERGHDLESGCVRMFQRHTGLEIIKNTEGDWIARDKEHPWLQASPDRMYWANGHKERGILECKTTKMRIDSENLPLAWIFQIIYYMGITGCKEGYIAWYGYNYSSGCMKIEFDESLFDTICNVVTKFWNECVLGDKIPDPVNGDEVFRMYPKSDPSKDKQIESSAINTLEKLAEIKHQIKELEATEEQLTNEIKCMCDDSERYIINGEVAWTYKTSKDSISFDKDAFAKENPELYAKYCVTKPGSRRLSIKK